MTPDFMPPSHLMGPTPLDQLLDRLDQIVRLLQLSLQMQQQQMQALEALANREAPPPTP